MEAQEGDVKSCEASKVKWKGGFVALPFIIGMLPFFFVFYVLLQGYRWMAEFSKEFWRILILRFFFPAIVVWNIQTKQLYSDELVSYALNLKANIVQFSPFYNTNTPVGFQKK